LEVYQLAIELSDLAWSVYEEMDWQTKKVIGDQFIRAIDSIGTNIAEGYGRYHYKDKVKFFYNSRGSLFESKHWTLLIQKRKLAKENKIKELMDKLNNHHKALNTYISSYYKKS
jgi:four helix bundle protein